MPTYQPGQCSLLHGYWWLHGTPRPAVAGIGVRHLPRYIATVETSKHRLFVFQPAAVLPDNMLVCIAAADAFHLGVLSSRIHGAWAPAAGGWLGFGNDPRYNKTRCFDPFPFPVATPAQAAEIAALAEELDALRKARLAAHPHLTLTGLYNVLAAIRAGQPLTPADRDVLDAGHVEVLRHLHDRLDAAVAAAYGWPADLPAAAIVERVVALNRERVPRRKPPARCAGCALPTRPRERWRKPHARNNWPCPWTQPMPPCPPGPRRWGRNTPPYAPPCPALAVLDPPTWPGNSVASNRPS